LNLIGTGDVGGKVPLLQEKVKIEVERLQKILDWVARGVECELDVAVGVTLEIRLDRFKKKIKWRNSGGKRYWVR